MRYQHYHVRDQVRGQCATWSSTVADARSDCPILRAIHLGVAELVGWSPAAVTGWGIGYSPQRIVDTYLPR
jgi:hypothetical protein